MRTPRAYWHDLREKMVKDPLPPGRVAAGWALGMFVGCAIPFGCQLVVSVPVALAARVSKIGATIGTLVSNPVTIWFVYPLQCWIGSRLIGCPLTWRHLSEEVFPKLEAVSLVDPSGWRVLGELGASVVGGFFAGGLLLGLVLAPATYMFVKQVVERYRKKKGVL